MSNALPRLHPTLRHLEQLMAQLLDGVILIDPTGTILSANAAALTMHGVTTLGALGSTAEDYAKRFSLRSADNRPLKRRDYPLFRLLAGDSFPDLVVQVAPAGEDEARWIQQVRDVVMDEDGGEPDCLALVLSDISDRFNAEARFKAMFQANPAPAIIVDSTNNRILQANPGFLDLTGFAPEQLVGKNLFALNLLDGIDQQAIERRLQLGEVVAQAEAELLTADGSRRLVVFAGQPVEITGDDTLLMTFADLEPRRAAEKELAASERHLSAIFELAPIAMMVTDNGNYKVEAINAAMRDLTGWDMSQVSGKPLGELGLYTDPGQQTALENGISTDGQLSNGNALINAIAGTTLDCAVSAETISVRGAPAVLWVFNDVTEQRSRERELADAIDAALADASWLSRSILDKLAMLQKPATPGLSAELSPRERDVLNLICDGLDDDEIAAHLELSRNTVRNHVARLYTKIGVNRRSGAVIWGRERGLGTRRT